MDKLEKKYESVKFKIKTKIRFKTMAAEHNISMNMLADLLMDHCKKCKKSIALPREIDQKNHANFYIDQEVNNKTFVKENTQSSQSAHKSQFTYSNSAMLRQGKFLPSSSTAYLEK